MTVGLVPDVRLVAAVPGWQPAAHLRINSGIRVALPTRWSDVKETYRRKNEIAPGQPPQTLSRQDFMAVREVEGRYVPKDDWRPLSELELDAVLGMTDGGDLASTVQVLVAPEALVESARRSAAPHLALGAYDFDEGLMNIDQQHLAGVIGHLDDWLRGTLFSHAGWHRVSVRAGLAGRTSASRSRGLHIDRYGPRVIDQGPRKYSGSRLVINLTHETRHAVFINLRTFTILQRHPELLSDPDVCDATSMAVTEPGAQGMMASAFMEKVSSYPVIRLALEPGWGYLAPTTLIPHDGVPADKSDDMTLMASHKGDEAGLPLQPPRYLESWKTKCLDALSQQRSHS
ncbi:MAG: hypothetical protein WDO56_09480 [Gammaproteobacteria bacterium]